MKKELMDKINKLEARYGNIDGVILLREAYPDYHPDSNRCWKCNAIKIENNIAKIGKVLWFFDDVEDYDEIDDASNLPWEDATENDFDHYAEYDLTDESEISDLLDELRGFNI